MWEWGVISILAVGNVLQTLYWSRQTHKLIDKLMSRNYAEYVQTEKLRHELPRAPAQVDSPSWDDTDEDLERLNQTLGGLVN